jgi:hypothetical protein
MSAERPSVTIGVGRRTGARRGVHMSVGQAGVTIRLFAPGAKREDSR